MRIKYGFGIVVGGFILITITLGLAIWKWSTAADVSTVLGLVTGVVGTVVGAFFGVQVGSQGKEKAEAERSSWQKQALHFAGSLTPEKYQEALKTLEAE